MVLAMAHFCSQHGTLVLVGIHGKWTEHVKVGRQVGSYHEHGCPPSASTHVGHSIKKV